MSSDDGAVEKSWKALWAIKAPGKMHITLWRFAHNCLPSGQQLLRLWDGVKERFGIQLGRKCFSTPKKWLFDFLARCSGDEATTLAVTFWHLWDARNKLREEGGTIDPSSVARKSMGMGYVVRGHSGDCMLARCDKIPNVTSPEMAEALAVRADAPARKRKLFLRVRLRYLERQSCRVASRRYKAPRVCATNRHENFHLTLRLTTRRRRLYSFVVGMSSRRRRLSSFRGVRARPNGRFYAELRADGFRLTLGTYNTTELATHAYDAAAWRFRRPRRDMNFPDIESLEEAEFLAPAPCLVDEENRRCDRQAQRRIAIAERDEELMR
ncbi:hypothetical protein QYE76_045319 [Lolium multiflorum]|uniref:AP2/ERF domain-containing protein n=1 Tax=Lolium multiflorum TaxID=4521 RepID=A0AAD8TL62_LOLMU|nr:hypothetical protein QYE76_045319 [Lolium multiflorum]